MYNLQSRSKCNLGIQIKGYAGYLNLTYKEELEWLCISTGMLSLEIIKKR